MANSHAVRFVGYFWFLASTRALEIGVEALSNPRGDPTIRIRILRAGDPMTGVRQWNAAWMWVAPVLLFLLLALPGITWGLPSAQRMQYYPEDLSFIDESQTTRFYMTSPIESLNPDEGAILNALSNMNPGNLDFNPHYFNYPSLQIYSTGALLKLLQALHLIELRNDKHFYLDHPSEMARIYVAGRCLAIAWGGVALFVVAMLVRALTGDVPSAAFGAFVLAVTPIWVRDSAFLLVNVPAAALMTITVWLSVTGFIAKSRRHLALAAVVSGFAAGAKYPVGVILALPIAVAVVGPRASNLRGKLAFVAIQGLLAVMAFAITTPYAFLSRHEFLKDLTFEARDKLSGSSFFGNWVPLVFAVGIPLALAWLIAMVIVAVRRPGVAALLLTWLALAAWGALFGGKLLLRYWIPSLPVVAATMGVAYHECAAFRFRFVFRTGMIAVLLATLAICFDLNRPGFRRDPRLEASHWVRQNVPSGSVIATRKLYFDLPAISTSRYHLAKLDHETCEIPKGAWHVTTEPFAQQARCETEAPVQATFENPPILAPLSSLAGHVPEDFYYTNLRIVVYGPGG